jgi:hypothetical protein
MVHSYLNSMPETIKVGIIPKMVRPVETNENEKSSFLSHFRWWWVGWFGCFRTTYFPTTKKAYSETTVNKPTATTNHNNVPD